MVFSTPLFLLLFLPLFLISYYLVPQRGRMGVILLGSWIFYGMWRIDFLFLLILVSLWSYFLGEYIYKNRLYPSRAKQGVVWSVILNLVTLGFFKYANFGLESLNQILGWGHLEPISLIPIILPVGISFYIFQAMSYTIDIYRGDAQVAPGFISLAAYLSLFPQLIAGPILRYKDLAGQLTRRVHSIPLFGQGFLFFSLGLAKKVLLADSVEPLASALFEISQPTFSEAWLGVLAFSVQLYFDFSGYSQMAIGLGLMLGFFFRQNFNAPYKSQSITEFWRRWHISLSSWLRDYLYIPLGGSKKGTGRTYLNLLAVMVLGGLWHGAALNFLLWGFWHGLWLVVERRFPQLKWKGFAGWVKTMILVMVGWVFFKAESFGQISQMIKGMLGVNGLYRGDNLWQVTRFSLVFLLLSLILIAVERRFPDDRALNHIRPLGWVRGTGVFILLLLSLLKVFSHNFSPFLYFRF